MALVPADSWRLLAVSMVVGVLLGVLGGHAGLGKEPEKAEKPAAAEPQGDYTADTASQTPYTQPFSESESPSWPPIPDTLDERVKRTLENAHNMTLDIDGLPWLFLTGADMPFLSMLLNCMLTLDEFGLGANLVIVCYDEEICNFLADTGLTVIKHNYYEIVSRYVYQRIECPHDDYQYDFNFDPDSPPPVEYVRAVLFLARVLLHTELVDKGISFFTFDADTAFVDDVRGIFVRSDTDIVTAADVGGLPHPGFSHFLFHENTGLTDYELRLNDGVASFRVTEKIKGMLGRGFARVMGNLCLKGTGQAAFNDLLFEEDYRFEFEPGSPLIEMETPVDVNETLSVADELVAEKDDVVVRTLPFSAYYNTCAKDLVHVPFDGSSLVHPNCHPWNDVEADMEGASKIEVKVQFFREKGLWLLRDDFMDIPHTGDRQEFLRSIRNDVPHPAHKRSSDRDRAPQ